MKRDRQDRLAATARVRLGEVTEMLSGGTPSKARSDYWGGDIPWVSAKDMRQRRLGDAEDHITSSGLANGSRLAPANATLILVRGMTLLHNIPICSLSRAVAFNQDVKAIVAKRAIEPRYLTYALLAAKPRLLSMVEEAGHGTGTLPTDRLKYLEIPLPTKSEQCAVTDVLGALDEKIELNRRMNKTLEAIARATFKSWFVDFDPVRAKMEGRWRRGESLAGLPARLYDLVPDSFEDSALGKIPKGWQIRPLDQIALFLNGLALQNFPPDGQDSLPVIKIAQLRSGDTKGADRASADLPPEYIVNDGDILFSWSGSLEVATWAGGRGALNQHLFRVASAEYPKWFIFWWLRQYLPDFQGIAAGKATTMGHIQRHHLSEATLPVPPAALLSAATEVVEPLMQLANTNSLQNRTLAATRDALLPKLISGGIRVRVTGDLTHVAVGDAS